ncbi:MAG: hypothetical protein JST28_06430 [Acidobacteria bacterium]|nr:hypothetical protein [Acidobacteriota bacterium]
MARLNEQFSRERDLFVKAVEPEVVALAIRVAERILRHEVQVDPLALTGAVRVALSHLTEKAQVRLRVPAADMELWRETIDHMPNLRVKPVVFPDDNLETGECRLECTAGSVDLGLDSQIDEVRRILLEKAQGDLEQSDAGIGSGDAST